jgi:hypothetical protein
MSSPKGFFSRAGTKIKNAFKTKTKPNYNVWEMLDRTERKADSILEAYGVPKAKESEINSMLEAAKITAAHQAQNEARSKAKFNELQDRLNKLKYGKVPKRRVSSRSTTRKVRSQHAKTKVSKVRKVRSATKTRSLYAASKSKKVVKRKGVKNYLSRVLSNVSDSVKNTGKTVLSPLRMKKTRK